MIDPTDKQTKHLNLDEPKRRRGRPKTGKAMSAAEKQRAYRNRSQLSVEEKRRIVSWGLMMQGMYKNSPGFTPDDEDLLEKMKRIA